MNGKKGYLAFLAIMLLPTLAIQEGEIWEFAFYSSPTFLGFLTGTLIGWLFYVVLQYSYGSKRKLAFDQKWSGALLHLLPAIIIAIMVSLIFPNFTLFSHRVIVGLIAVFTLGGSFLLIREYTGEGKLPNLADNPYKIWFRFVERRGSDYVAYDKKSGSLLHIECSASQPMTVALLTANDNGRPHCRYPLLKVNEEKDILYHKGQPFTLSPPRDAAPFRLWIVGSPNHDQLMDFIGQEQLNWPAATSEYFKIL